MILTNIEGKNELLRSDIRIWFDSELLKIIRLSRLPMFVIHGAESFIFNSNPSIHGNAAKLALDNLKLFHESPFRKLSDCH